MAHYTEHAMHAFPLQTPTPDLLALARDIKQWGASLGFQQVGIAAVELADDEERLARWLDLRRHGEMHYMERHGRHRARTTYVHPPSLRAICVRMDYQTASRIAAEAVLGDPSKAYVSRYALGRDYHKVIRQRLARLAAQIEAAAPGGQHRAVVDSAPVLEKALARNAGLGWIGKHTNLLNRDAGSWFFLGEILTDIPLPADDATTEHCGSCRACLDVCPTQAIVAPYELDARRCISYLTIELRESIPHEFRKAIGNRIYGCDDCQLFCPWNKFAKITAEPDFQPRHRLEAPKLVELFDWTEEQFLKRTEGSAIRRIGYECWLRNIAIALGNAPTSPEVVDALKAKLRHPSELVREHVMWALDQHHENEVSSATSL